VRKLVELNQEHLVWVKRALTGVVTEPEGTAHRGAIAGVDMAGKTGTAQVFTVGQKESYRESQVSERMRDHALFIAFAPLRSSSSRPASLHSVKR